MNAYTSKRTNGETYSGIQEYKGLGQQRWCALCGVHKPSGLGWTVQFVGGMRTSVCPKHPKVAK